MPVSVYKRVQYKSIKRDYKVYKTKPESVRETKNLGAEFDCFMEKSLEKLRVT